MLDTYCQTFLLIQALAQKSTKLLKANEIIHGTSEYPTTFLQSPRGLPFYIPICPDPLENGRVQNIPFVTQSTPNIRKKLQKLEGFKGTNRSQLLEVAKRCKTENQFRTRGTRDLPRS